MRRREAGHHQRQQRPHHGQQPAAQPSQPGPHGLTEINHPTLRSLRVGEIAEAARARLAAIVAMQTGSRDWDADVREAATRTFEILVDGVRVGEQRIERHRPGSPTKSFFDAEYTIPAELVKGKQKVTVRFQATGSNETAGVFVVRMVRADQ